MVKLMQWSQATNKLPFLINYSYSLSRITPWLNLNHWHSKRMDPTAAGQQPNNPSVQRIQPTFSPLHPPSVQRNIQTLSSLSTLTTAFAGALAGILGLVNWQGFAFYVVASLWNALAIILLKTTRVGEHASSTGGRKKESVVRVLKRCLPGLNQGNATSTSGGGTGREDGTRTLLKGIWQLSAIGQENVLTFLLFWIGFYVSLPFICPVSITETLLLVRHNGLQCTNFALDASLVLLVRVDTRRLSFMVCSTSCRHVSIR
jgi:hypothetical protein